MSWLFYLLASVELLQLAIICLLVAKYRAMKRRLNEDLRFSRRPPRSITEESLYSAQASALTDGAGKESWLEAVRRRA
jgi:hypothetical protein